MPAGSVCLRACWLCRGNTKLSYHSCQPSTCHPHCGPHALALPAERGKTRTAPLVFRVPSSASSLLRWVWPLACRGMVLAPPVAGAGVHGGLSRSVVSPTYAPGHGPPWGSQALLSHLSLPPDNQEAPTSSPGEGLREGGTPHFICVLAGWALTVTPQE